MVKEILNYMHRYWVRYPEEKKHDLAIDKLLQLALQNNVYLYYGVFIIYTYDKDGNIIVIYYCFDFQENLRQTMKAHKRFTKNRNVYMLDFKDTYKRKSIAEFDSDKNIWRFL